MAKRYKREPGDIKRFKSIKADEYKADVAKLRALRREARYTQRRLAAILGESQTFITNVETRIRRIDIYEAKRWEQACLERIAEIKAAEAAGTAAPSRAAGASRLAPPARHTLAGGASTSQPSGMGLPLAADEPKDEPPAAGPNDSPGGPDAGAAARESQERG